MGKKILQIGLVQQSVTANVRQNIINLVNNIRLLASKGAELIILPELHNSLYFCQTEDVNNFDLADTIPGNTTKIFADVAHECNIVLVTSLFERRAAGVYHNTAVVFEKDGNIAGIYRKMHIPDDPGYYEKFYFTPGDLGFKPIETSVGRLGVQVCWDQWFPESARLMALQGANLLIYPTAIGFSASDTPEEQARQHDAWMTVQRGHAIANGIPLIAVNRVGFEKDLSGATSGIQFWGTSFMCGAQGEILAQGSEYDEENIIIEADMLHYEEVRRWWPYLRDRRIDEYDGLLKRFIED